MEAAITRNVGVDISKATLDVHLLPAGSTRQFTSDAHGIKALLGWLGDYVIARIVFEPTGPYHHRLERQPGEAGLPLAKVNPPQARRFAQAAGTHAQTDAIDAALKARLHTGPDLAALTGITMFIEMPEPGQLDSKQAASGKPAKVAIVTVMRKLIFAIARSLIVLYGVTYAAGTWLVSVPPLTRVIIAGVKVW